MPESKQQIANNLHARREQAGYSAAALAEATGVSRQTIYAIEKGTYIPNTVLALGLARKLGVAVEDLFSLPEPDPQESTREATLLSPSEEAQPGQPVQLCDVDGHLVALPATAAAWFLPTSDGIVEATSGGHGWTKIKLYEPESKWDDRILIAGCDPAMSVLARLLHSAGVHTILFHRNSSQALALLKQGHVHIAGTHLQDEGTGEYNTPAIKHHFRGDNVAAFSFAIWQEGLLTARANPKQITGIQDLTRRDVKFLNREHGAGSRALLDRQLRHLGIDPKLPSVQSPTASGHLAAAWAVSQGLVDCSLATQAAARFFGLHFLPLASSRYDLVIRREHLQLPAVRTTLDIMSRLAFRSELRSIGGYDTAVTGNRIL